MGTGKSTQDKSKRQAHCSQSKKKSKSTYPQPQWTAIHKKKSKSIQDKSKRQVYFAYRVNSPFLLYSMREFWKNGAILPSLEQELPPPLSFFTPCGRMGPYCPPGRAVWPHFGNLRQNGAILPSREGSMAPFWLQGG